MTYFSEAKAYARRIEVARNQATERIIISHVPALKKYVIFV
jgi:hypothetical protein